MENSTPKGFHTLAQAAEAFGTGIRNFQATIRPHLPESAIKMIGRRPYFRVADCFAAYFAKNAPQTCPTCGRAMSSAKPAKKTHSLKPR